ncbi:helix-turn-helix domain-containing protein [Streptomyces avicenniae]|uniref:helix-turn-helix domain-containing protein n=1 Tax=Streptomyces avicenniae TaxID=500153 RepID=UPI00069C543A|nr:XRE family transcriptional regulator [Streptomyces avicenniae]
MTDIDQLTQALARNLKRLRTERGFTLDGLAARARVSRGMIVQIEQARTNPSIGTVVKIVDALGVGIPTLLDFDQAPAVRLFPPERAVRLWETGAGSHGVLLAGTDAPGPLELWHWRLMPGEGSESDPHPVGTSELLHVTTGSVVLTVDGVEHTVPAGTSAAFESHVPHSYRNDGAEPAEMSMAVSVPGTPR